MAASPTQHAWPELDYGSWKDTIYGLHMRTQIVGKIRLVTTPWVNLAVTRFSGRPAPRHPGGVPHLPDAVTREAYSHEVSSAGFWPGGGAVEYAAFYSYAYPTPEAFMSRPVEPGAAFFHDGLGEFLLPYDAVRTAADPNGMVARFLETTYTAAAETAHWDRQALERVPVRPVD